MVHLTFNFLEGIVVSLDHLESKFSTKLGEFGNETMKHGRILVC